jgi:hypothetical protein
MNPGGRTRLWSCGSPDAATPVKTETAPVGPYEEWGAERLLQQQRIYDANAAKRPLQIEGDAYYYGYLRRLLTFIVEEGRRVLCVQSDVGQYLEWVKPSRGVGVDTSAGVVEVARTRCPQYEFHHLRLEHIDFGETFDYILIPNAVNGVFYVQEMLAALRPCCEPHTRVVIIFYNFLWQPLVNLAEKLHLKMQQPPQNWLSARDLTNMLRLEGFELVQAYRSVLAPKYVPLLSNFLNGFAASLPVLNRFCFVETLVARPALAEALSRPPTVSVVIPCKNERANIEAAVLRIPAMGSHTELIFCDDRSTDGTADEIRRMQREHPDKNIRLLVGPGVSKARNVWTGFDEARGEILMILDGDLSVPPEELPRFYRALVENSGEFINGSRLVFPMRDQAMRLPNVVGNKVFSLLFSYILRQNLKDTLCGTKVLWRKDYERIRRFRGCWGIEDRWGDYELIFGAAKCHLKIVDMPVHYMERIYGKTKMTGRLKNAAVMFRMCVAAYRKFWQ